MTKRESRVINSFINCVEKGEFTFDYACLLIEDNARYGWLSEEAKEVFYAECEPNEDEQEGMEEASVEEEPEE